MNLKTRECEVRMKPAKHLCVGMQDEQKVEDPEKLSDALRSTTAASFKTWGVAMA